jgi:3-oxoacyl-[acyl-carrier protein] reductase
MVEGEKVFAQPVPMGRMARPEELAATICFFLSEDSSFVIGQTLLADGGESVV